MAQTAILPSPVARIEAEPRRAVGTQDRVHSKSTSQLRRIFNLLYRRHSSTKARKIPDSKFGSIFHSFSPQDHPCASPPCEQAREREKARSCGRRYGWRTCWLLPTFLGAAAFGLRPIARKSRMIDKTPFFRAALGVVVLAAGALCFGFIVMRPHCSFEQVPSQPS
jgi:hypothetical protein